MTTWRTAARGQALAEYGDHVDRVIINLTGPEIVHRDLLGILSDEDAEALYASLGEALAVARQARAAKSGGAL